MAYQPQIVEAVERVRLYADEPALSARWSDDRILRLLSQHSAQLMQELNNVAENPITVRFRVNFVADKEVYALPPYVDTIVQVGIFDTASQLWTTWVSPKSRWNPSGRGFEFLHQSFIRVDATIRDAFSYLDVEFIPTGELQPYVKYSHQVNIGSDRTTWPISQQPDIGDFDRRSNAYVGSILRIYDGPAPPGAQFFVIRDFLITDYDSTTGRATVAPDIPSDWQTGAYSYEILPVFGRNFLDAVTMRTAMFLVGIETPQRQGPLREEYRRAKRAIMLSWSQARNIFGRAFSKDTVFNDHFMGWPGWE
ncbi:MAG: hypothetical protein D6681_20250 [Calditrichaeota bacterium]|nr:MAG: hypothetical protein D6681_20250 [Calditrichota bacterium]